jgi:hypothetical protein
VYKLLNGMWMFQMMPELFLTRFDGFTWLFMRTGVHQWLVSKPVSWALFDGLFYAMPLVYLLCQNILKKGSTIAAVLMLLVNWIYVQSYTLFPTNSIEAHIAWLLFPITFLVSTPKTFRLLIEGLRYFFLFFFVSAGVWKIVNGGLFNPDQMSGVLLYQHAYLLSSSPGYWQTEMIEWLITHKAIGFTLYVLATLLELVFVIGFFTKKYDHLLIVAFIVFVVFDHLLMRIPYYELLPFLITMRIVAMHQDLPSVAVQQQNHIQSSAS